MPLFFLSFFILLHKNCEKKTFVIRFHVISFVSVIALNLQIMVELHYLHFHDDDIYKRLF